MTEGLTVTQDRGADSTVEIDAAAYQVFARTWAVSARRSAYSREQVERRVIHLFKQLVQRVEPAVVLEIGAHEAGFSRWAAEELPDARVIALEANPHVHAKYAGKLARTRVDYRNLAVAPVSGEIALHLPLEVHGKARKLTSHMASLGRHTGASDEMEVMVPSARLDECVSLGEGERVVAWIDVEGANGAVLESGPELLERTDAIYIEVEWEETWEGQWLDVDVATHLRRHGLLPIARDIRRPHQYNVVFARAELAQDPLTARQVATVLHGQAKPSA